MVYALYGLSRIGAVVPFKLFSLCIFIRKFVSVCVEDEGGREKKNMSALTRNPDGHNFYTFSSDICVFRFKITRFLSSICQQFQSFRLFFWMNKQKNSSKNLIRCFCVCIHWSYPQMYAKSAEKMRTKWHQHKSSHSLSIILLECISFDQERKKQ